jgi:hypothetical protein
MFIPKFWTNDDNLLETIHGQGTQPIKILKHGFIGNVKTYSNKKKVNDTIWKGNGMKMWLI